MMADYTLYLWNPYGLLKNANFSVDIQKVLPIPPFSGLFFTHHVLNLFMTYTRRHKKHHIISDYPTPRLDVILSKVEFQMFINFENHPT